MTGFLIFLAVWIVFGYIGARLWILDGDSNQGAVAPFILFFMGIGSWLVGMFCVTGGKHTRKKAHFISYRGAGPNINMSMVARRLFAVKESDLK